MLSIQEKETDDDEAEKAKLPKWSGSRSLEHTAAGMEQTTSLSAYA